MNEKKSTPVISVLIPVKNGEKTLRELLASLTIQTLPVQEVLVADSSSCDDSVVIAKSYGAKIIPVAAGAFDHGGTRTMLAHEATGELLLFLTQDAILRRKNAIELLVKPLLRDESIGSCFGRQLPAFDADHFATSLRQFNYPETGRVFSYADKATFGIQTIFTSNSFACYRRAALEEIGYFEDGLIFGEDTIAVAKMIRKGYKNCYVAEAEAYHSHNYTVEQEFRRYFDIGVLHSRKKALFAEYGKASGRGKRYIAHEIANMRNKGSYALFPELIARLGAKFLGYRLGLLHRRLPMKFIIACSMNSIWWQKENHFNTRSMSA